MFPIVGLGASAGGAKALRQFFANVPARTGVAFVVVQHLYPDRPGLLPSVLEKDAPIPVIQAASGIQPQPDHAYVIAPGTCLTVANERFQVTPASASTGEGVIDSFFRSLAAERGGRAAAILFSGAGHDGTAGLHAIKARGGLTLVQAPETARHDGMPRSAIAAGVADEVLAPDQLAARLLEHLRSLACPEFAAAPADDGLADSLDEICALIRRHTGNDFSRYKEGTLLRRVTRRMQMLRIRRVSDYLELLRRDAGEAEAAAQQLLIGVTQFFRDPDAFTALAEQVFPRLLGIGIDDACVRIWVAGCASGEEAYSLAMLFDEWREHSGTTIGLQLFATDLDAAMLAEARLGQFPPGIAEHVGPARLARYFRRSEHGYEVTGALREMCIFSEHSLGRDPPFSRVDLIACRNVLIYFSPDLQEKLIPVFHYALRPGGFLFLGPSEGVGSNSELFETIDKSYRIFRRRETLARPAAEFPLVARAAPAGPRPAPIAADASAPGKGIAATFERIVLEEYAPPCAIVNERGDLLRVAGRLDRYVRLPAGAVSTNLVDLLPAPLGIELGMALQDAADAGRSIVRGGIRVELDDGPHDLRLTVRPLPADADCGLFIVAMQEAVPAGSGDAEDSGNRTQASTLGRLEAELRTTRAQLQSKMEDFESANAELQSANEELQASQEELQSLNEELETVNAELRQKVAELAAANSDLQNLFASADIATLFLDRALRIVKFTPAATELFHLIDADIGRPVGDLASSFASGDLIQKAQQVLANLSAAEHQVRTRDRKRWFIRRMLPYRTLDNQVEGVVVTYVDITELKRAEAALRRTTERERFLAETIEHATTPFAAGTADGRLMLVNRAFVELTGYSREELETASVNWVQDLTPPEWRASEAEALAQAVRDRAAVRYEKEYRRSDGARLPVELVVQPVFDDSGALLHFRGFVHDITERKRTRQELEQLAGQRQLALDAAKLGWWHYDPATRIASWDRGYKRIFGVEGESRGIDAILRQIIHPEDLDRLWTEVEAALDPDDPKPFAVRYRINRPDGCMRWIEAHGIATFEGDGKSRRAMSFVGTVADVTERKEADEQLRAALTKAEAGDRLLAALMAHVPEGITLCDANGHLRMMSRHGRELLGARSTGQNIDDVSAQWTVYRADGLTPLPPEELPLSRALTGEVVRDVELIQTNDRGENLALLCNATPIHDAAGQVVAAILAWRDITVLKKAETAVRESELRLRLALTAARMVAWEYDAATGRAGVAAQSEAVLGLSRRYEPGPEGYDRIHAEDLEKHRALVSEAIATCGSYASVYRLAGERVVWLEEHAKAIGDTAGKCLRLVGVVQNITERKLAEGALREAHDTREAILDNMTDGLLIADPAGDVIDINPAALRLHGFSSKSDGLRSVADYARLFEVRDLGGEEQAPADWPLSRAYRGEIFINQELRLRRRDTGQTFVGSYGGAAVRDAEGRIRFGIITIRDISAQKHAEEQIRQLAFYDPLTGLPNRRLLEERLSTALTQVKREGGCLAVMVLDLDHFKAINDALGHAVGDALLVEVARRMTASVRTSDTVARPGGDEFMLVLPGGDAQGAAHLAEKLVARLAEPMQLRGHNLSMSCSLGISLAPRDSDIAGELIARADTAMYRAKQAGRNRYQFFTEQMQLEALRIMTLEHRLRRALAGDELRLHFQPQVAVDSGRPIGLEALVRWAHPEQGLLGAHAFVPLAERSGLILDIDTWVLHATIRQLQAWAHSGLTLLPVALNLSAQQFRHRDRRRALGSHISELLSESGLSPSLLELEITENSLLEESDETLAALQELRALGVRLTLDDFGTGYSSLSALNAFPVDRLKIDQSFVRAAPDNPKQAAIVETILALGRHLNFEVIAEGVETDAHLDLLKRHGCRQAQGYYFSKPLPPEEIAAWLRRLG